MSNLFKQIPIKDLYEGSGKSLPENIVSSIESIKKYLTSEECRNEMTKLGFSGGISEIITQGSHADKTGNKTFKMISKEDIDLICLISNYTQSFPTIIRNPENNKRLNDWVQYLNDDLGDLANIRNHNFSYENEDISYRNISDFVNLKKEIYLLLRKKFQNFDMEMGNKVIKIRLTDGQKGYTVELAFAGRLDLQFETEKVKKVFGPDFEDLKESNLIKQGNKNGMTIISGFNIITSVKVLDRYPEYYYELPNFSKFNKYYFDKKNKNTNNNFRKYVRLFKNFVKIWNEKNNQDEIDISSFHIECSLNLLSDDYFYSEVDIHALESIANELVVLANNYNVLFHYNDQLEINHVLKMMRNMNYSSFRKAWEKIYKSLLLNYE